MLNVTVKDIKIYTESFLWEVLSCIYLDQVAEGDPRSEHQVEV